jgi:hypothetical protein
LHTESKRLGLGQMALRNRQTLEDRAFELLDDHTAFEISEKLDLPYGETVDLVEKVIMERGTPRLAAASRAIERLAVFRTQI